MRKQMQRRGRTVLFIAMAMLAIIAVATIFLSGCGSAAAGDVSVRAAGLKSESFSPVDALNMLIEGNKRFRDGHPSEKELGQERRVDLAGGQHPFAVIVTCSDSRVPPEYIFDRGLGEIFVIRVAGNVISEDETASVEYAVEHLDAPLVMVMGHEDCGAVKAAIAGGEAPGSLGSLVEKISPAVGRAHVAGKRGDELLDYSIRENVRTSIDALKMSPVLKEKMETDDLRIVGGEYHLASGRVDLLPDMSE